MFGEKIASELHAIETHKFIIFEVTTGQVYNMDRLDRHDNYIIICIMTYVIDSSV